MRFIRLLGLPLALALTACTRGTFDDAPLDPLPGERPPTPRLVFEQEWAPPLDVYPTPFGLGPEPTFLVRARQGGAHALALVGPDRPPAYFSRTGDGPGEVRDVAVLNLAGDTAAAFDFANQRVARWDTSGAFLGQARVEGTPLMTGPAPGGTWVASQPRPEGLMPVLVSVRDGSLHPLLSPRDSFRIGEFGGEGNPFGNLGSVGRWSGGFLLANGKTYRIGGYDWQGRLRFVIAPDLGPNLPGPGRLEQLMASWLAAGRRGRSESAQRDRFASESMQWFSHLAPPRQDAVGRIWVVGIAGDSTFADAWWHGEFLGRTMLDCGDGAYARWNLAGDRIALSCPAPADDSVHDLVYRIWRIEDDSTGG